MRRHGRSGWSSDRRGGRRRDRGRHYTADWHTLAGIAAGALALGRGRSLSVVFLVAVAVTAILRAVV